MATRSRVASAVPGQASNLGTALAHRPALQSAFSGLYSAFWTKGIVDQPTKEVTRIRNARITDCNF